jgi:hypothetical protein
VIANATKTSQSIAVNVNGNVNGNNKKKSLSIDKEEVKPSYGNKDVNLCLNIITKIND